MKIAEKCVVSFHYALTGENGEEIENSKQGEPMAYLHGSSNIIPGLEKAMEGHEEGDSFSVTVPPEEAYGTRSEANIQRIPLKRLGNIPVPKPGQVLGLQTQQGPVQVTVVKVGKFNIDVDANHPLSGETLTFAIEVVSIREATEEELSHGHAHGVGGHHHD